MNSASRVPINRKLAAYIAPMLLFFGLLAVTSALKKPGGTFWRAAPEYWVFPLQTILCAAAICWFWREYDFGKFRWPLFTIAVGVLVFLIWISPQAFFHFAPRLAGFDPNVFAGRPLAYWSTVAFRFLRLVIVVPLVEEIFWRGFLLRYLISEKFQEVPFGSFSWLSFICVTLAFCFEHSAPDWMAAAVTGVLYNVVAYRAKSLTSCVLVHALTNLLLGLWIMHTRQWGFW